MPLHEYKCKKCGDVTEHLFDGTPPKNVGCPSCHGRSAKIFSTCHTIINQANNLDHFGTKKHAHDRARQCGVEV